MREAAEDTTHGSPPPQLLHRAAWAAERLLQPPQSPSLARILPQGNGEQQRWRCSRSGAASCEGVSSAAGSVRATAITVTEAFKKKERGS